MRLALQWGRAWLHLWEEASRVVLGQAQAQAREGPELGGEEEEEEVGTGREAHPWRLFSLSRELLSAPP